MKEKYTKNPIRSLVILLGLLLSGLFFCQNFVRSQELTTRGISISPIRYEFSADPGETITEKMKVYNPTDGAFSVVMESADFQAVGEEGQVVVGDANSARYSLKNWVTTDPKEFMLSPRQEKFVTFTIRVPEQADPGGKYGSLLAVMTPSAASESTGSIISQKVGSLILLSVAGPVSEILAIKDITAPPFSEYGPVPFGIRFQNQGTVHVKPRGFLAVANMLGKKTADLEIEGQNVIPGATRKIETKLDKKWLFGKYSARLVGDYGQGKIPLDSPVVYFWVIPWKITLSVLILAILFFWILYRSRKRWIAAFKILVRGKE